MVDEVPTDGTGDDHPAPSNEEFDEAQEHLRAQLAHLREEHADLSAAVDALSAAIMADQIRIARLKKRKLALRDQIALIENRLTPDLIA